MNNIKKVLNNTAFSNILLNEIEQNEKNNNISWDHDIRRQKIKHHIHTQFIPLITTNTYKDKDSSYLMPYLDQFYPHTKQKIQEFEHILNGKIVNAMYVKLFPEQKIYPHKDGDEVHSKFYELHDRYHFVLKGKYELIVEEEKEILISGDLVLFNNCLTHSVNNLEKIDRISLIFDLIKSNNRYIN